MLSNPAVILLIVLGVVALALVFRFLAGLLTILLALAIAGFGLLLAIDAVQGGKAYVQLTNNVSGWLTNLAIAIAGLITTFLASRSRR